MIDLHNHLLPAIDDGPEDVAGSLAMARAASAAGITAIAVTPHVNEVYPTRSQQIRQALATATAALAAEGIALRLLPGAEIALDQVDRLPDAELRALSLGGGGTYALLECPFVDWPIGLELHTGRLAALGMRTLFAHPERCAALQDDAGVDRLAEMVERGLLVQVNAGSVAGLGSKRSHNAALRLLERGLVHVVASDAHDTERRPPDLRPAMQEIGDAALARWLTQDVPAAIVSGERLPERPATAVRRRGGLLARLRH